MRYLPIGLLIILLASPFVLEQKGEPVDPDAPQLVIVTPHNEQIRWEFKRASSAGMTRNLVSGSK